MALLGKAKGPQQKWMSQVISPNQINGICFGDFVHTCRSIFRLLVSFWTTPSGLCPCSICIPCVCLILDCPCIRILWWLRWFVEKWTSVWAPTLYFWFGFEIKNQDLILNQPCSRDDSPLWGLSLSFSKLANRPPHFLPWSSLCSSGPETLVYKK